MIGWFGKLNRNVIGWNARVAICTYVRTWIPLCIYKLQSNCSDDKTGNVFDEVPTHQKDALDEMFIYFSENEPEISSEHLKLQSGARYSWKEGNNLTCCAKAWRFYYGISEWQHK